MLILHGVIQTVSIIRGGISHAQLKFFVSLIWPQKEFGKSLVHVFVRYEIKNFVFVDASLNPFLVSCFNCAHGSSEEEIGSEGRMIILSVKSKGTSCIQA